MKDWISIREEYITGSIGLRSLAEERGVSINTLKHRAAKEGWYEKRLKYREMKEEMLVSLTTRGTGTPPETMPQNDENEGSLPETEPQPGAEMIYKVSELMLKRILTLLPRCGSMYELRSAASALEDIKDVLMSHPSLEVEEQQVRIERLRSEIMEREKKYNREPLEIRFIGDAEELSR